MMANFFDQFDSAGNNSTPAAPAAPPVRTSTPQDFASTYGDAAARAGQKLGVDPHVLLGQWGLETGWGKSVVPGTNNLGNIKDMTGSGVAATDNMTGSKDKYRTFATPNDFADHYADLIGRKYQGAVGAGSDASKFAGALAAGGYAQDPNYAAKVTAAAGTVSKAANPMLRAANAVTSAIMPSAQAATPAAGNFFDQFDAPAASAAPTAQAQAPNAAPAANPTDGNSLLSNIGQGIGNLAAGAVRGAGSIGATLLAPYDMAKDAIDGKGLSLESNRQRRAAIDGGLQELGAQPDSKLYGAGKIGGEIAGTLGVGGVLANGVRAVAPGASALANAVSTGGFTTGANLAKNAPLLQRIGDVATRVVGGAVNGGASAALADPDNAGSGAAVGAALPLGLGAIRKTAAYAGGAVNSLVQPFTSAGQDAIAGKIINKFAQGAPTTINAGQIISGSAPTLAEATGNAGIAGLQRVARDINPNAFTAREAANAGARNTAFDNIAGDATQLGAAKAARSATANDLYRQAINAGVSPSAYSAPVQAEIGSLMQMPAIQSATKKATELAKNEGLNLTDATSIQGMHYTKMALDQQISSAITQPGGANEARILQGVKDRLTGVMNQVSPQYAQASQTFADMSKPINQMQALQGLKLTDAQGNITLAKIQNAIRGLTDKASSAGINGAKSLDSNQLNTLTSIRDDLLRQSNLGAGKSAGSNTFQNLATNNILNSTLGEGLTGLTGKLGIPQLAGQIGKVVYSGPNEAIRNRVVDMMLQPELANKALNPQSVPLTGFGAGIKTIKDAATQGLYRGAPVALPQSSSRR